MRVQFKPPHHFAQTLKGRVEVYLAGQNPRAIRASLGFAIDRNGQGATDVLHFFAIDGADIMVQIGLAHREEIRQIDARPLFQAFLQANEDFGR